MATKHIASWAYNLKYSDLPVDVISSASRSFYNWAGCAIGGSTHPATTIAVSPQTSQIDIFGLTNLSTTHYLHSSDPLNPRY
jgi:2-methylcitrate dehydratase PrpD